MGMVFIIHIALNQKTKKYYQVSYGTLFENFQLLILETCTGLGSKPENPVLYSLVFQGK